MPIAATAAGEAPQWQALMATLAESSRGVPESYLVGALQQQCNMAPLGEPDRRSHSRFRRPHRPRRSTTGATNAVRNLTVPPRTTGTGRCVATGSSTPPAG